MTINFLFTANIKSLIKFNGKILGVLNNNALKFCTPCFETAVIEILPFNTEKIFCNQSFLIDSSSSLNCKSNLIKITKFTANNYGIHFCLKDSFSKTCLKALCQQTYVEKNLHHTATVFFDGSYSLVIECEQFIETYDLPDITDVSLSIINIPVQCILLSGKHKNENYVKIIRASDDYHCIYDRFVKEIKTEENKLLITEGFDDHMGHALEKTCSVENDVLKVLDMKKLYTKAREPADIVFDIIPYVFIESIENFFEEEKIVLTEELQSTDQSYFKSFFGDFIDVMQNPVTKKPCTIKKITGNYFEAVDYNFEFENGKISNIFLD